MKGEVKALARLNAFIHPSTFIHAFPPYSSPENHNQITTHGAAYPLYHSHIKLPDAGNSINYNTRAVAVGGARN
jgi:hypothetical protein